MTTDKKDFLDELVEDRTRKNPDFPTKLREAIERRKAADKLRLSEGVDDWNAQPSQQQMDERRKVAVDAWNATFREKDRARFLANSRPDLLAESERRWEASKGCSSRAGHLCRRGCVYDMEHGQ